MFNAEKYKWLCEHIQEGYLLRVAMDSYCDIDIQWVSYKDGIIVANDQFDITDVTVYARNDEYRTMQMRYQMWPDQYNYYHDPLCYEWRPAKHV